MTVCWYRLGQLLAVVHWTTQLPPLQMPLPLDTHAVPSALAVHVVPDPGQYWQSLAAHAGAVLRTQVR